MVSNRTAIALIGFGEVGQTFARAFARRDDVVLSAYDILIDRSDLAKPIYDGAAASGVRLASSAGGACAEADIVISAVTASQVLDAAEAARAHLRSGQIFLDVNSASPATKKRAAMLVSPSGAHYVEGAMMAPVLAPGLKVPILAGGPMAKMAAERLNALGMNLTAVSEEWGRASAIKLCRSIVVKGLEALMVDCAAATRHWNVADEVFGSLQATWPGMNWAKLAEAMSERVVKHGIRRAAEMREAADMLTEIGVEPNLVLAVADAQERKACRAKTGANQQTAVLNDI